MDRKRGHLPGPVQTVSSARRIKVLTLGEPQTGKSCLIKRYCEGRFIPEYIPTIGVDYGVKTVTVKNAMVKVNFWDLAGDQVYFEIRNEFFRETQGAVLVYDVTSRVSFMALEKWATELSTLCETPVVTYMVANKTDLSPRAVTEEEGREFAEKMGYKYIETSAESGVNVSNLLESLFNDIFLS